MLEVNGESGGQMLRSSLGLSALLRKPVTIYNIRAKRPNPGLQAQHLTGLNTLKILSSAKVHGAVKGSMKVVFKPEQFSGGNLNVNIGTAGSVMLLVQAVMLPSMLKETKLRIFGGTDVPFAPSFNYSEKVLFPVLSKMNARFSASLVSRGFYPKGNGSISFKSLPAELPLNPIKLTKKKKVKFVWLFSHSASLPQEVFKPYIRYDDFLKTISDWRLLDNPSSKEAQEIYDSFYPLVKLLEEKKVPYKKILYHNRIDL